LFDRDTYVDEAVVEEEADKRGGDVGVRVVQPPHGGRNDLLGVRAGLVVEPERQIAHPRIGEGEGEGRRIVVLVIVERDRGGGSAGIRKMEAGGAQDHRSGKQADRSPTC
jgi:hypothetical protein